MTTGSLMKVESIGECSPRSIGQYFWPALSNNWSWKPIFGLFESGHFTQVLLYSFFVPGMENNGAVHLTKVMSEIIVCDLLVFYNYVYNVYFEGLMED